MKSRYGSFGVLAADGYVRARTIDFTPSESLALDRSSLHIVYFNRRFLRRFGHREGSQALTLIVVDSFYGSFEIVIIVNANAAAVLVVVVRRRLWTPTSIEIRLGGRQLQEREQRRC